MLTFLKKYRLPITIAILILVPLFNLSSGLKLPKELKWYDKVVLWMINPFQQAVTGGFSAVLTSIDHYVMLVNAKKENDFLIKENNRLTQIVNNIHEVERENQRLRSLLAFKERYLPSGVTAEVIARDTTSEYQTIRINKGLDVGLKRRMPVISPAGVIGELVNVWGRYSDVLLITDQNQAMDVIVQRSRARGIVKGGIKPKCELHYIARMDDVVLGDIVVTSGIEGIFPKGLLVGKVSHLDKKKYGATQRVEITPTVNLSKLEEVFVVTDLARVRLPEQDIEK